MMLQATVIENWDTTGKRFGLACFLSPRPLDIAGDGDASMFFPTDAAARAWAERSMEHGRFGLIRLWRYDDEWVCIDEFKREDYLD